MKTIQKKAHQALNNLTSLTHQLKKMHQERKIALPENWQRPREAINLNRISNLHQIATIPKNSINLMQFDQLWNCKRNKTKNPHGFVIFLTHSLNSRFLTELDRQTYFANLKGLKRLIRNLKIHPILNLGQQRNQWNQLNNPNQPKRSTETHQKAKQEMEAIVEQKRQALNTRPIDWEKYHRLNYEPLNLLPQMKLNHHNINKILRMTNFKEEHIPAMYYQENAYTYAIINLKRNQTMTYIGQTGMHKTRKTKPIHGKISKEPHYKECRNTSCQQ